MKEFKPFRLDPREQVLWRVAMQDELSPVHITAKAFDVLRYLVEHPGRLITHDELLDALWPGIAVQPEILKGHILAIRHALGDDARAPRYVETLRGRGYRFIAEVTGPAQNTPIREPRPPLVGRQAALATLQAALTTAHQGRLQVMFVDGEMGVGKTALVEQFAADAADMDVLVSSGCCIEGFGGTEPFYPVLEVLGSIIKSSLSYRAHDILVSVAPSWAWQLNTLLPRERQASLRKTMGVATRGRMLGEFIDLLEALGEERKLLIVLEDLHWSDHSTLDLLSAVARRKSKAKALVVGTFRMDDTISRASPLKRLVDDLHVHNLCKRLHLHGLDLAQISTYLQSDCQSESAAFAELMWKRSNGNPLFIEASLDHLRESGFVIYKEGCWHTDLPVADIQTEVPPTIRELIEAQIELLDEEAQRVLEVASAVGDVFDPIAPATAAGLSALRFEAVCETLCRSRKFIHRHQLETMADGVSVYSYRFKHALYRNILVARQGRLQLAKTHALIGKELEYIYPATSHTHTAFALVEQFTQAQEWAKSIAYLKIALQTAKRRFAHEDALSILDKADAIALKLPDAQRSTTQAILLEERASIYAASHDVKALDAFRELADLGASLQLTDVQTRAELGMGFALSWGDAMAALTHLQRAATLSLMQDDPQLKARTQLSSAAWHIWIKGWNIQLARTCDRSLLPLRNGSDRMVAGWGMIEYSMVCLVSSRYREAIENIDTNVDYLIRQATDKPGYDVFRAIWMAHIGRPWAYIMLGEWGKALEELDKSEKLFVSNANRYNICTLESLRGLLCFMAGDYTGTQAICRKLGLYRDAKDTSHPPLYTLLLPNEIRRCAMLHGLAEAGLGHPERALQALTKVESEMIERPVLMDWYWRYLVDWGLADALLGLGASDRACIYAESMLERARSIEEKTWLAMALEIRARIAVKQGEIREAQALIEEAADLVERMGISLMEWRVRRTAADIWRSVGNLDRAAAETRHYQLAVQRILQSLPPQNRLRETYANLTGQ